MAKTTSVKEIYLPSLWHRLLDETENRFMGRRELKQAVIEDLQSLLNARSHGNAETLASFPEVATSVVNFGIPDVCGSLAANVSDRVCRSIAAAIRLYEPRMYSATLSVRPLKPEEVHARSALREADHPINLAFEISGELRVDTITDAMFLRTLIDLETGECITVGQ